MVILIHFPGEKIHSQTVKVAEISAFLSIHNFSECLTKLYHSLGLSNAKEITVLKNKIRPAYLSIFTVKVRMNRTVLQ